MSGRGAVNVFFFRGDGFFHLVKAVAAGSVGGAADIVEDAIAVDVEYAVLNELAGSRPGFRAGKVRLR